MIRYEGGGKFKAVRPEGLDSWERLGGDTALTWRLQACGLTEADIDKHCIDRQGNLWYTSSQGLTLVTFHEQRMQQLPVVEGQQTRTVLYRRDGTVWAGTQDGYIRVVETDLSGQSGKWVAPDGRVTTSRVKFADRIYALFEDSQGRTWIGTKGVGLYVIGKDGGVTHCMPDSTDAWSINHHFVYDFDEDLSGNIWIATYGGGINIVPAKPGGGGVNKQSLRFLHSGNELKHYPIADFARVRRITHTPQGIMLISSTTGLLTCRSLSVTRQPSPFYVTRHHHDDTSSLRTNDVMQVLVTKSGEILVATLAGGIQRLTSTELEHNDLQLEDAKLLNNHVGNVQSMTEDHQGNVWIIREMSIDRYSPQTQRLQQFDPTAHHPSLAAHHTSSITTHHPDGSPARTGSRRQAVARHNGRPAHLQH
jgi:ligand-binding sensor domain-containing protein